MSIVARRFRWFDLAAGASLAILLATATLWAIGNFARPEIAVSGWNRYGVTLSAGGLQFHRFSRVTTQFVTSGSIAQVGTPGSRFTVGLVPARQIAHSPQRAIECAWRGGPELIASHRGFVVRP